MISEYASTSHPLDTPHFALLDLIVRRLRDHGVTDDVRLAVDQLTASAAPDRAGRLAVRPLESPVLVERLAVWALHRASPDAMGRATELLERPAPNGGEDDHVTVVLPADVSCSALPR